MARAGCVRGSSLFIDRLRHRIREPARRIGDRWTSDGIHVEHPVIDEGKKGVVDVVRELVELTHGRGRDVRAGVAETSEQAPVLLEHDAVSDQKSPR